MFFEQMEKLCRDNGTTITATISSLGMSKGSIANWKRGTIPNGDAIVRLAAHFNVSTDYLLLGTGSSSNKTMPLTDDGEELMGIYNKLDNRGRHRIHTVAYEELDRIDYEAHRVEHEKSKTG